MRSFVTERDEFGGKLIIGSKVTMVENQKLLSGELLSDGLDLISIICVESLL